MKYVWDPDSGSGRKQKFWQFLELTRTGLEGQLVQEKQVQIVILEPLLLVVSLIGVRR